MNDNFQYIKDIYNWALAQGVIKNKREFSKQIGINYATTTTMLSDKSDKKTYHVSGKQCIIKVKNWREQFLDDGTKKSELPSISPEEEQFRRNAAKDILCHLLNNNYSRNSVVDNAVELAEELLLKLKGQQ